MTGLTAFTEVTMSLREINCNFVEKQGKVSEVGAALHTYLGIDIFLVHISDNFPCSKLIFKEISSAEGKWIKLLTSPELYLKLLSTSRYGFVVTTSLEAILDFEEISSSEGK